MDKMVHQILLLILLPTTLIIFFFFHSKERIVSIHKTAIYITTGSEAHNIDQAWGGCHITLTGFHEKHSEVLLIEKIPQILADNRQIINRWYPEKIFVCKKEYWRVIFESETLNSIARDLKKHGFERIKGPEFSNVPFHMDLPDIQSQEAAEIYAQEIKNKPWFVTVVKEESVSKKYKWLQFFRLNKDSR